MTERREFVTNWQWRMLEDQDLHPYAKLIALVISLHDGLGEPRPSRERLMALTGLGTTSIKRYARETSPWVEVVEKGNGRGKATVYNLRVPEKTLDELQKLTGKGVATRPVSEKGVATRPLSPHKGVATRPLTALKGSPHDPQLIQVISKEEGERENARGANGSAGPVAVARAELQPPTPVKQARREPLTLTPAEPLVGSEERQTQQDPTPRSAAPLPAIWRAADVITDRLYDLHAEAMRRHGHSVGMRAADVDANLRGFLEPFAESRRCSAKQAVEALGIAIPRADKARSSYVGLMFKVLQEEVENVIIRDEAKAIELNKRSRIADVQVDTEQQIAVRRIGAFENAVKNGAEKRNGHSNGKTGLDEIDRLL